MDGNGRWAKIRSLSRVKGHEKGAETVRTIVRASREIGISHLTLYAFSTENWQRPSSEVAALMALLSRFLNSERAEMLENGIRLSTIGDVSRLPAEVQQTLDSVKADTAKNTDMVLTLALSYGGREEILRAAKSLAKDAADGKLDPEGVTEQDLASRLYTAGMPDPDLLIRTSGEMRISNFLLWQAAYSELFFTPTLWPDFTKEEYLSILNEYAGRERRFGKTGEQIG
ncbi:MAG: isoprenyl transferase [Deltaproteobacteria bacterium]|nr:isoprenyl transferase [Deltaproteobacteria bacterium]